jgi:hypothetical protein
VVRPRKKGGSPALFRVRLLPRRTRAALPARPRRPVCFSVVSFGGVPTAVPEEEEIAALRLVVESGLPARPCPYLEAGNRVNIEQGCLAGVSGILVCEKATYGSLSASQFYSGRWKWTSTDR